MFDYFGRRRSAKTDQVSSSQGETASYAAGGSRFKLSTRNFADFQENDVPIKLWLPEPAERRLIELSEHWGLSRAKLLRFSFFRYLYGQYEFEAMRELSAGLFWLPTGLKEPLAAARKHRSGPNTTPELGKNDEDVKLWLPTRMKTDLQKLADQSGKPLSQFIREVLVFQLFGHLPLADALRPDPESEPDK